jgi:hypothetical protein
MQIMNEVRTKKNYGIGNGTAMYLTFQTLFSDLNFCVSFSLSLFFRMEYIFISFTVRHTYEKFTVTQILKHLFT